MPQAYPNDLFLESGMLFLDKFTHRPALLENYHGFWKLWFSLDISSAFPEVVEGMIERKRDLPFLAQYVFTQKSWGKYPKLLGDLVENGDRHVLWLLADYAFLKPHWAGQGELLWKVIERGDKHILQTLAHKVFPESHWAGHPELVMELIKRGDDKVLEYLAHFTLSRPYWDNPELLWAVLKKGNGNVLRTVDREVLSRTSWRKRRELRELLGPGVKVSAANLKKALEGRDCGELLK